MRVIGLMSGTSLDGIDAALVEIEGRTPDEVHVRLAECLTVPYPPEHRARIHACIVSGSADAFCTLHAELGEWLASAAEQVAERAGVPLVEVDAIGSHGQTVWHRPPDEGRRGSTLQLGDPATIAERTGCTV
ncbi:MAG: anhydro-N-acetylmuramic acid kinase, partial [Gemmatimonadota bacterium]|nr:anhydro-N-acetylmuramic acid kinase [Gemmatimonadota bacterium]